MDLRWNQNGHWLLTASRDHLLKVFDIRNMKSELQTFKGHKKEATCEKVTRLTPPLAILLLLFPPPSPPSPFLCARTYVRCLADNFVLQFCFMQIGKEVVFYA